MGSDLHQSRKRSIFNLRSANKTSRHRNYLAIKPTPITELIVETIVGPLTNRTMFDGWELTLARNTSIPPDQAMLCHCLFVSSRTSSRFLDEIDFTVSY